MAVPEVEHAHKILRLPPAPALSSSSNDVSHWACSSCIRCAEHSAAMFSRLDSTRCSKAVMRASPCSLAVSRALAAISLA